MSHDPFRSAGTPVRLLALLVCGIGEGDEVVTADSSSPGPGGAAQPQFPELGVLLVDRERGH